MICGGEGRGTLDISCNHNQDDENQNRDAIGEIFATIQQDDAPMFVYNACRWHQFKALWHIIS